MLLQRPLRKILQETWEVCRARSRTFRGPMGRISSVVKTLKWNWVELDEMITDEGHTLRLVDLNVREFQHEVREAVSYTHLTLPTICSV
eukprot:1499172-Karenia_brevis.AAC.1